MNQRLQAVFALILFFGISTAGNAQANVAPNSPKIKLLNYNVGLLTVAVDFVGYVQKRAHKIPDALEQFISVNQPDVILLEEVWSQEHQDLIGQKLTSLGYKVAIPVGIRGPVKSLLSLPDVGYKGSSGFVLAWNSKTVEAITTPRMDSYSTFDLLGSYDQGTGKGIVSAQMRLIENQMPFLFVGAYSTALDVEPATGVSKENKDAMELERVNFGQMQLISNIVANSVYEPDEVVVVMGDLNIGPGLGESTFRALEEGLEVKASDPAQGKSWDRENILVKTGAYPNDPSATIDHIFVRGNKASEFHLSKSTLAFTELYDFLKADLSLEMKLPLSDHYGVYVEGYLVKPSPPPLRPYKKLEQ